MLINASDSMIYVNGICDSDISQCRFDMLIIRCDEQAKHLAKKRNAELQAEHDASLATNEKLVQRAKEMFGAPLEAAEKKLQELQLESHRTNIECIELEEQIR